MTTGMNWTAWNSVRAKAETSSPRDTPTKASISAVSTTQPQEAEMSTSSPHAATAHRMRDWMTAVSAKAVA